MGDTHTKKSTILDLLLTASQLVGGVAAGLALVQQIAKVLGM